MGSALARREGTTLVPGTPVDNRELADELRHLVVRLDVIDRLSAYGNALEFTEDAAELMPGHIYLLELDIPGESLRTRAYKNPAVAVEEYGAIERAIEGQPGKDVVLVTVESLSALRRAYPNYFLDTTIFVESVREAIR